MTSTETKPITDGNAIDAATAASFDLSSVAQQAKSRFARDAWTGTLPIAVIFAALLSAEVAFTGPDGLWFVGFAPAFLIYPLRQRYRIGQIPQNLFLSRDGVWFRYSDGSARALPLAGHVYRLRDSFGGARPLGVPPGSEWQRWSVQVDEGVRAPLTQPAFRALLLNLRQRGLVEIPRSNGMWSPNRGEIWTFASVR